MIFPQRKILGSCSCSMKDQIISDISSQGLCSWGKQFSQLLTMSICFLLPSFEEYLSKKRFRCVLSTISLEERLSKSGKGVQFAFCKNFAAVMNFSGTIIRIFWWGYFFFLFLLWDNVLADAVKNELAHQRRL